MVALVTLALSVFVPFAQQASSVPTSSTIVFVCEHGAAKSLVATAYFNKIAAERGEA
jgi:hypothetical protein